MHAVILTFPGHFYQTHLCVQSLQQCYPETSRITFIIDDIDKSFWADYPTDFQDSIKQVSDVPFDAHFTSESPLLCQCVAGWWRQQLVKLCLDTVVDGDYWFVVDGDTVFRSRCDIFGMVPVTRINDTESSFSKMSDNYVRTLLGTAQGYLTDDIPVCTNAVPFRYLDRSLLQMLRKHIESRFGKEMMRLHLDWFEDQTIVADWDPPVRMTMSEWELIECYRKYVLDIHWPFVDVGAGHCHDVDLSVFGNRQNLFVHAYRWDYEIGNNWFKKQGLLIDENIWHRVQDWHLLQRKH